MKGTTAALAEFVAGIDYKDAPASAVQRVKRQCIDLVGVALAGSAEQAGQIAARQASRFGGEATSTIWGGRAATAPNAAFANGVAAHALDYDDFWLPGAHPSAPIVPAAFALAELLGSGGAELIAALLAGYELMGRLHSVAPQRNGWHPTGVYGTFGAVAACARLLGCSAEEVGWALGIAASSTSGVDAHEGTMTKPFHAGQSARNGLWAALLAADGFTANDAIFDPGHSFFDAFQRGEPIERWRLTVGLGSQYWIDSPGIGIKMHPAGYYMLQTFEAALKIVIENDLSPDDINRVEIGVKPGSRFDRDQVRGGLEGKFSLQYVATMAIVDRRLDTASFSDESAFSPAVLATMSKVRTRVDSGIPDNQALSYNPVTIACTDGRRYTESVVRTRSHWDYPLTREEWVGKFTANAETALTPEVTAQVLDALEHLEDVTDVRQVGTLLGRS
jgi:2-methylcitrate dehydratase PrpD